MEFDQWSHHDSQRFKTITSESETRNQTSNKKVQLKNDEQPSIDEMKYYLNSLGESRRDCIQRKKYRKVATIDKEIQKVKKYIKRVEEEENRKEIQLEEKKVYFDHQQQMRRFKQVWEQIFTKYQRKQDVQRMKLKVEEQREIRCASADFNLKIKQIDRRIANDKRLKDLQKIEESLLSRSQFQQLKKQKIPQKRNEVMNQIVKQRQTAIVSLHNQQKQKLSKKYEMKYNTLEQRLKKGRDYEIKVYKKHEARLQQKFLNKLQRLQHISSLRQSRCKTSMQQK